MSNMWTSGNEVTDEDSNTMGITIAYRARLGDLDRIEDFEDRLVDLALEVGGQAQIWRTHADNDPKRMIRGVILNLAPGLESTSMFGVSRRLAYRLDGYRGRRAGKVEGAAVVFHQNAVRAGGRTRGPRRNAGGFEARVLAGLGGKG